MAFLAPSPVFSLSTSRPSTSPRRATTCMAKTPFQPLADRVLVRIDERENKTSGGIFLSSDSPAPQRIGTVVAVGPGRYSPEGQRERIDFAPGDRILWKDEYGAEKVESSPADGKLLCLKIFSVVGKV